MGETWRERHGEWPSLGSDLRGEGGTSSGPPGAVGPGCVFSTWVLEGAGCAPAQSLPTLGPPASHSHRAGKDTRTPGHLLGGHRKWTAWVFLQLPRGQVGPGVRPSLQLPISAVTAALGIPGSAPRALLSLHALWRAHPLVSSPPTSPWLRPPSAGVTGPATVLTSSLQGPGLCLLCDRWGAQWLPGCSAPHSPRGGWGEATITCGLPSRA